MGNLKSLVSKWWFLSLTSVHCRARFGSGGQGNANFQPRRNTALTPTRRGVVTHIASPLHWRDLQPHHDGKLRIVPGNQGARTGRAIRSRPQKVMSFSFDPQRTSQGVASRFMKLAWARRVIGERWLPSLPFGPVSNISSICQSRGRKPSAAQKRGGGPAEL